MRITPLQIVPPRKEAARKEPDLQTQLELLKKLTRLSRVSWSPTLKANAEALKLRTTELTRVASRQRSSKVKDA